MTLLSGCKSTPTLAPGVRKIEAQSAPVRPRWLLNPERPRPVLWRMTSSGEARTLEEAERRAEQRAVEGLWLHVIGPALKRRYPLYSDRWKRETIQFLLSLLRGEKRPLLVQEALSWWARGQIGGEGGAAPFVQFFLRLTLKSDQGRERLEDFIRERPEAKRAAAAIAEIDEALTLLRGRLSAGERALMTRSWEPVAAALRESWSALQRLKRAREAYQRETSLDPPRGAEEEVEAGRAGRLGARLERLAEQLRIGLSWRTPTSLVRARALALFSAMGLNFQPRWGCEQGLAYLLTIENPKGSQPGRLELRRCPFGERLVEAPLPWPLRGADAARQLRRHLSAHLPHLMGRAPPPPPATTAPTLAPE
ncbi:MAG: hypothetical protein VYD19_04955 [Myxococcota bacterium]|nr:hypothetical protein [Myxococcota bacterium]